MEKEITTNEIMDFLRENMATKVDLEQLRSEMVTKTDLERFATKTDLEDLRTEMTAGFRMIREELSETNSTLHKLAKRTLEDTDALAADVLRLDRRVEVLEHKEKIKS